MSDPTPPADALDAADLEAASEKPPKRNRGRPRVTSPDWDAIASYSSANKSRRTIIKYSYMARAANVLEQTEGQDFGYLIGPGKIRSEIRAELGQLDDDERIREAAAVICEGKVKAKDAVARIRAWRNGKASPGDTYALAAEITRVIRSYNVRHPGTTPEQVRVALQLVGLDLAENEDESGDDLDET
jgi:hypothetical protein